MLKTVVLHNIFVETEILFFSRIFDELKVKKTTTEFILNGNLFRKYTCLLNECVLNKSINFFQKIIL